MSKDQGPSVLASTGSRWCRICNEELPPPEPSGPKGHAFGPFSTASFEFGSLDFGWDLTIVLHWASAPALVHILDLELTAIGPPSAGKPILALGVWNHKFSKGAFLAPENTIEVVLGTLHIVHESIRMVHAIEQGGLLMLKCSSGIVISQLPIAHIRAYYCRRD